MIIGKSPTLKLFIFLACIASFVSSTFAAENAILGKSAPEFSFPTLTGEKYTLASIPGKIKIINFWATWCTPCQKEIPLLNKLHEEYTEDGLQIIGIAIDNAEAVKKFIDLIPIEYLHLIGGFEASALVEKYGNQQGVLPYTVIIDRRGKILSVAAGLLTEQYLRKSIEKYL